jgi:hypothetical protein
MACLPHELGSDVEGVAKVRALRRNPIRWNLRTTVISATAGATAIALAVSLVLVLSGGSPPDRPGQPSRSQSLSPFTTTSGQPMTFARGPVWIVLAAGG